MPYIQDYRRKLFEQILIEFEGANQLFNMDVGDLNYIITKMLHIHLKKEGKNYNNINSLIGVLECAKMELYRKVAAPYENKKIKENGDV